MKALLSKLRMGYLLLALFCFAFSLLLGWSSYATRINHNFYDLFFRQRGPRPVAAGMVIVAIDDATLARYGALPLDRSLLARGIRKIQQEQPRLLAVDLLLADVTSPESDKDLEAALELSPAVSRLGDSTSPGAFAPEPSAQRPLAAPVVLATALEISRGAWLHPLPRFLQRAAALGHAHADPDADGVSRQVLLAKQGDRRRYWALALECFRILLSGPQEPITETEETLEVAAASHSPQASVKVPATRAGQRALLINYAGGNGRVPRIGLADLLNAPSADARLRGKIVLLGVTAQAAGDRLFTPFSSGVGMAGVEIHANILHTLLTRDYLRPVGDLAVVLAALAITAATAWGLARLHGLGLAALLTGITVAVLAAPYRLFLAGQVWPAFSLCLPLGTTLLVCGAYQLLSVRRKFTESEVKRRRTRQQFEMATHEMRTPLTAIQGSSELLSRYPLEEAKRDEIVRLIYEESQRLGKLVERFLNMERLSAGEMELQRAPVDLSSLLSGTAERLRPAAERKGIGLTREDDAQAMPIEADAELLEFAIANLLSNAVKYSPAGTCVRFGLGRDGGRVQVYVSDSGTGFSAPESRRIFARFYRTEAARRSNAPGFGLGLAIAREIALHHGGDLRVETKPGAGSRFTILLPAGEVRGKQKQTAP